MASDQPKSPSAAAADSDQSLDLPNGMFRSGTGPQSVVGTMPRQFGAVNVAMAYTAVGDNALFEGDIVLATLDEVRAAELKADAKGIGIVGEQYRWPEGKIAYVIADEALRGRVEAAIAHWQQHTPFKFSERTSEADYISFEERDGCWSRVGRQGGKQVISLAAGCGLGAAIHEIGHAIGLWHEQSRADRDNFVEIVWANIIDIHKHNFNKHVQDGEDLGNYDHGSIMHYPAKAFSKNGQDTIRTRDGTAIGQRNGLSRSDIESVRKMYPNIDWSQHQ